MNLRFRPWAERDIDEARTWYGAQALELEARFAAILAETFLIILAYPLAFQEVKAGVRHVSVPGFPYLIYYLPEAEKVIVLRVLHMKRQPEEM